MQRRCIVRSSRPPGAEVDRLGAAEATLAVGTMFRRRAKEKPPPSKLGKCVVRGSWPSTRLSAALARVSPTSPERCGFTHPLGDLIQISQERVDVRFVLTRTYLKIA
jgi:hypothetical protein